MSRRVRTARVGDHTGESSDFPGKIQESWHVKCREENLAEMGRTEILLLHTFAALEIGQPLPSFTKHPLLSAFC